MCIILLFLLLNTKLELVRNEGPGQVRFKTCKGVVRVVNKRVNSQLSNIFIFKEVCAITNLLLTH